MKKKKFYLLLFMLAMLACPWTKVNATNPWEIDFHVTIIDPNDDGEGHRGPIQPPTASLDGYTFTIIGAHPDFLVRIVDVEDEDDVIYQTLMPAATSSIILPSTLSGDYQIQLIWDIWMFYGLITL